MLRQLARLAPLLVILAGACSEGQAPSGTPIVFNEPLPDDPGPDVGGVALQERVFADGRVTFDEYEQAVVASIECMRDEGFDVRGPTRYPDGFSLIEAGWDPNLRLGIEAQVRDDPNDTFGKVNGRCQAQWSHAIEQMYLRQFAPTEDEVRAWLERAWRCREELNLGLSNPPTESEAVQAVAYGCRPWESDE